MSVPQMTTAEALRSALASTIACSAQELQEAVGQLVVATSAECPDAGSDVRSLSDPQTRTTVLLADRIPAGQEAQVLAAEIARHHGRQATQAVLGERADDLLVPEMARIEFKVFEPDPGRSLGAVFVPKGEPLSGGLFGDAQTDMVEFSDLRCGVARAVKYLDAAAIAGISKDQRYSAFFGATISVDDSQKLAAWVAELQGRGLAKTVDQAALADKAFADYEFGDGVMVTDSSGWEHTSPGHVRSRKVYVETEGQNDGPPSSCALNFTVRFDPDTGSLTEAYAMDEKGQIWGAMPSQGGLAQEEVTVHDFVGTPPGEVYDRTQTDDSIKDGDVLNLGNGNVAILMKAWPTVVLGEIENFHRLATGVTFESVDDGKYAASAAKARELSGYIEQLPSVGGGHAAYEATPEDVENVLRSNSLAVALSGEFVPEGEVTSTTQLQTLDQHKLLQRDAHDVAIRLLYPEQFHGDPSLDGLSDRAAALIRRMAQEIWLLKRIPEVNHTHGSEKLSYRVLGAHPNRNFFAIEVQASDGLSAFGAAAVSLKEADEDGEAEFFAAIPAHIAFDFPGDGVVTLGTVLDPEQADVFGLEASANVDDDHSPGM